tara:strand:+ start:3500 stop:4423 length:924 start_codon:yes stop_codon:yes gene_type:complete
MIVQKDFSWLEEKVPNIEKGLSAFGPLFAMGGFVAGGFLRRAIFYGDVFEALNVKRRGDIDFFFPKSTDLRHTIDFINEGSLPFFAKPWHKTDTPNSWGKFAYEWSLRSSRWPTKNGSPLGTRLQVISGVRGNVFEVMKRFDLANCKIATDLRNVYIEEDWEKLEADREIRIDSDRGDLLLARVSKYLNDQLYVMSAPMKVPKDASFDYVLTEESKDVLFNWITKRLFAKEPQWGSLVHPAKHIRELLLKPGAIRYKDISLFVGRLGNYKDSGSYAQGSLAETPVKVSKDWAIHALDERRNEQIPTS